MEKFALKIDKTVIEFTSKELRDTYIKENEVKDFETFEFFEEIIIEEENK